MIFHRYNFYNSLFFILVASCVLSVGLFLGFYYYFDGYSLDFLNYIFLYLSGVLSFFVCIFILPNGSNFFVRPTNIWWFLVSLLLVTIAILFLVYDFFGPLRYLYLAIIYFSTSFLVFSLWGGSTQKLAWLVPKFEFVIYSFINTGIGLTIYMYVISPYQFVVFLVICYLSLLIFQIQLNLQRPTAYLRMISGRLAGHTFYLDRDIFFIGSDQNDDLQLGSYYNVRPSHVKIVRYAEPNGFLLIDNSFDELPQVNYRSTAEQVLEKGDIISLAGARFQFFIQTKRR